MKITKVETIRVASRRQAYRHGIWVQIYTDEGHVGLGDTWYGPMAVETAPKITWPRLAWLAEWGTRPKRSSDSSSGIPLTDRMILAKVFSCKLGLFEES